MVSDIKSIHYSDGIIADYTQTANPLTGNKKERPIDNAGTMKAVRWTVGVNMDNFDRNSNDNLLIFWRNQVGNKDAEIGGNTRFIPILLKMSFVIGNSGRNYLGDELQLVFTPSDAIFARNTAGNYEIKLQNFYYNIVIFYGHTLNHKRNLIGIFDPGINLGFMSGTIKLNNTVYNISGNLGSGYNIGSGIDWLITKRLMASGRAGYRTMKTKESHESATSSTNYASFYINHAVSDDLLDVKWNGPYFSVGLAWSFYTRLKLTGR